MKIIFHEAVEEDQITRKVAHVGPHDLYLQIQKRVDGEDRWEILDEIILNEAEINQIQPLLKTEARYAEHENS